MWAALAAQIATAAAHMDQIQARRPPRPHVNTQERWHIHIVTTVLLIALIALTAPQHLR